MNKVNIDTVLLTYGGYLQKLHDFCSALVVRHQKSQAKFCWNFKFHWAPVQPLVFSLFWWSPFHISVTLIPVQRSQQNWKVRQLASDGGRWGERDGGINVGYKPLITSWETPQCPPSPASYPTRWTVPTLCRGRQNMIAIKFPKSLTALESRLFCSQSLLNRDEERQVIG